MHSFSPLMFSLKLKANLTFAPAEEAQPLPEDARHVCRLMVHLLCRQVVSVGDHAGQLLLQPGHEPQRKRRLALAAFARLRSLLFLVNLPFGANRFWVARSVFRNFSYLK